MNIVIIYIIILIIIVFFLSILSFVINLKMKHDREKFSVFECGFDLLSSLRLPFSLNFYFITIIFLIFDVELTLILPFIYCMNFLIFVNIIPILVFFFIVLIAGFIYEWTMGLLNWLI